MLPALFPKPDSRGVRQPKMESSLQPGSTKNTAGGNAQLKLATSFSFLWHILGEGGSELQCLNIITVAKGLGDVPAAGHSENPIIKNNQ